MNTSHPLTTVLQQAGMRLTPQRQAICDLLAGSEAHPTAAQIYEALKPRFASLSLATVYNTLETLLHLGAINALGSAGDDQTHYDADNTPHVNLACVACHKIVDVASAYVQPLAGEIASASGFKLLGARVLYYGLCPACQSRQ